MWYEIRDAIGNKIIQWIMKHIHCDASTYYICCEQYYPEDVKAMSNSFFEENIIL